MSRGAADLSALKAVPDEIATQILKEAEAQLGWRCAGCGERITVGFKFSRLVPKMGPNGKPQIGKMSVSACSREECDFAEQAREGATIVEMIEFAWLAGEDILADEEPEVAPAPAPSATEARASQG